MSSRLARVLVVLAPLLALSCGKKETPAPAPAPTATVNAPESPVPAPEGLVAEMTLRSADALVASLRANDANLPDAGKILGDLLHVPSDVASLIDGSKPAWFVATRVGWIAAVSVKDGGKAIDGLSKGSFARTDDATTATTIFQSTTPPVSQIVGVRRGYLLAASTIEAMRALAPYATRTLPTKPLPSEDAILVVPQAAMRTTVKETLRAVLDQVDAKRKAALAQAAAGGGSAAQLLAAITNYAEVKNDRAISWFGDAGDGRVSLTAKDGAITLRAEIPAADPASAFGKEVASWASGSGAIALDLPGNAAFTCADRETDAARAQGSRELLATIAATFPDAISVDDRKKLDAFFASWDAARGDAAAIGVVFESAEKVGLAARLAGKDAPALAKLLREGLTSLFAIPGVAEGLEKQASKPRFSTDKIGGVDVDVVAIDLPKGPGDPKAKRPAAEVVWGATSGDLLVAAGVGARAIFADLAASKGALGVASPSAKSRLDALGGNLAAACTGFVSRVVPILNRTPPTSIGTAGDPVIVALGKSGSGAVVTIDASFDAVQTLVKMLAAR